MRRYFLLVRGEERAQLTEEHSPSFLLQKVPTTRLPHVAAGGGVAARRSQSAAAIAMTMGR